MYFLVLRSHRSRENGEILRTYFKNLKQLLFTINFTIHVAKIRLFHTKLLYLNRAHNTILLRWIWWDFVNLVTFGLFSRICPRFCSKLYFENLFSLFLSECLSIRTIRSMRKKLCMLVSSSVALLKRSRLFEDFQIESVLNFILHFRRSQILSESSFSRQRPI